jgi:hypothetical protein
MQWETKMTKTKTKKTITLIWGFPIKDKQETGYRVKQIIGSTAFKPNETLTKGTVDGLCKDEEWKVIMQGLDG